MNIESRIEFVMENNGHRYIFSMPMGVPYGEAYDAAFHALEKISDLSQEAVAKAKRNEQESLEKE